MRVQQINTTLNSSAPGKIAEEIGKVLQAHGHESYIGYGRRSRPSASHSVKIGNFVDQSFHGVITRLFDLHGFGSAGATRKFVKKVREINPDIIHLHNIHGYFINLEVLFEYLKETGKPVVWTLHDCWPFTGHCSHFDFVDCQKWRTQCFECPNKQVYPRSLLLDNSRSNYLRKREAFSGLKSLTIVTPSDWLKAHVENSFLKEYRTITINNGIDLNVFRTETGTTPLTEKLKSDGRKMVLGVANLWGKHKGLADFVRLSADLPENYHIVLVGLNKVQQKNLPRNITGISRTESVQELAALYAAADVFVNPTYVDNFPTTNIEALACGTPVITYDTGGSPEAISETTGHIVRKGDIPGLMASVRLFCENGKNHYSAACRNRAEALYDKNERFNDYINLFRSLLQNK